MVTDSHLVEPPRRNRATRGLASAVSDTLGPLPPLAALCAAGPVAGLSLFAGIRWGLLAMFFVAILPYVATWRIRHPANGRRPSSRARASYMGLAVVTAALGLLVLHMLGAPGRVFAAVSAILVSLVVVAVTNARWGWSNHMAACCAGVAMLVVLVGPGGLWAALAVPAVGWARLALDRHVPRELLLGGAVGAVVSAAVLAALT